MNIVFRLVLLATPIVAVAFHSASAQQPTPGTGLVFADEDAYASIPLASSPLRGDLPREVDHSGDFPEPGDQGAQGSCVGWAVAYGLKSFQEKRERRWDGRQQAHLFSPAFVYNQICSDCNSGSSFLAALDLMVREGVATLERFPYNPADCSTRPDAAIKQAASEYRTASWRRVNVQDSTEIKSQLASGFPVLIGMKVDAAFHRLGRGQTYSARGGDTLGPHAMVVTGYSDDRNAFRVLNSWGRGWADDGYGWIEYPIFKLTVREAYVVQDIVVTHPAPTSTPRPTTTAGPVTTPRPTANPTPTRPPTPPPAPRVAISNVVVTHNIASPSGFGMSVRISGRLHNAASKTAQIVVRFLMPNGQPLMANVAEPRLRDAQGLVATGTDVFAVTTQDADLGVYQMFIPYYALNMPSTNGQMVYNLGLTATVYVDNFQIGQSAPTAFALRW